MTGLDVVALAAGASLVGAVAGWLARRRAASREDRRTAGPAGPDVATLARRVIGSARNGIAVLDRHGDVVLANRRAAELGVVHGSRADERAWRACERAVHLGEPVDVDLSPLDPRGRQPEAVLAEVRPLGDGYAVVDASDESDAVRLEATRRDFVANVSHELKTQIGRAHV